MAGSPQDRAAFDQAIGLRERGRRAEAARECEAILRRSPGFAPAGTRGTGEASRKAPSSSATFAML